MEGNVLDSTTAPKRAWHYYSLGMRYCSRLSHIPTDITFGRRQMAASPATGESGLAWSLVGHGWTRQCLAVERAAASERGVSFMFSARYLPGLALVGEQAGFIAKATAIVCLTCI